MAAAQTGSLGFFQDHLDIGNPKITCSSSYDPVTHTYTISGSNYNIGLIAMSFNTFANFEFIGDKGNNHRKIDWILRKSMDDNSTWRRFSCQWSKALPLDKGLIFYS
jgi:hypothetical protein